MLISDLMTTNFICCTNEQTLKEVLPMFTETQSNILPVVDDSNKLIGIITKSKVFQALASQLSLDMTINQIYNPNPIFLHPTDHVEETRKLLLKYNVGHAPVVNKVKIPVGVISTKQLLSSYNIVYSQLSSVLDIAYDAIILVNKKAEITMVNKGFTDLFGLTRKEVLNKSTTDLFPELDIEMVINTGISIHNNPHIIEGQQSLISISPIKENGEVISAICKVTYRGLTHLHEALTKVKELEKKLSFYRNEINEMKGTKYTLFDIAGESEKIRKVKHEATLASKSMSTVLIIGESGTGKELFAQGIHAASSQRGTFVQVNCAAIPPELLESELFGYVDGAFTGAKKGGMKGKFEWAQNGTIFLDEIGDMPLTLQTKILRVLQEKEFQPIGSSRTIHLNTKIIAATNQNIEKLVSEGKFREDLYYRLNIIRLDIPPLRERLDDLPDIIQAIIQRLSQNGFYIRGVTHSALTQLMKHTWPGNVRELNNVLERAANLKTDDYIDAEDIPAFSQNNEKNDLVDQSTSRYKDKLLSTERDMIISALKESKGNKTKASQLLGISRPWLYAKIKKYNIE
ncbi:sigma 54-interacting transcriptional regulator [Bacillus sp. DTU_2020_1000418_1_SI_GHA_SEK_038]|uniref:sigma 54-interacting transcriptional regulator n=1 Tax=Bacillus sp. DTU_2020_1000418_1_SI_GHA_SEK_038 TaxID=3077585 RepID=UPI0028EA9497|nr:sigma 54-interacting transcriptional regulator [Bacillus sp. DTU_2020_1000418_1_SI_GHA_SEK_038]WNS76169.1 sigma 54-interacting transcriptional regulator [Bacillus sp. DTU_2020_1000418_1_SI_GHA_SEK_038]